MTAPEAAWRGLLAGQLDAGESEALAYALSAPADLVLLDERLARRVAKSLGLTVTGTLGVLLRAKQAGLVAAVRPMLEELTASGAFLIETRVLDEVLRAAGE